jgi:hypothetical protein
VDWRKLLEAFKLVEPENSKVRWGQGVVGNNSSVAKYFMIAFAISAYGLADNVQALITVLGILVFAFLAVVCGNLYYGHKHPDHALMEGTELLEWHRLQRGASDPGIILEREPITGIASSEVPAALEGKSDV